MRFAIELPEETVKQIKHKFKFRKDAEVRNQLQFWVGLCIYAVFKEKK